ncbi:MAG: DinB family protein [Chloroflexi bacterium]|nr:MAG: DinB family protein [Chloroflexota bacterium]
MKQTAAAIYELAHWVTDEQAKWKPDPASWSMLEVVNHLYDEEREDFRVRLDYILHHPAEKWPPIDPEGWVTARAYNKRDLAESLANFRQERERSLTWLATLTGADWQASYETPFGPISAGDMLVAWAGHDLLHLRQLVELHWAYRLANGRSFRPDYAGRW